MESTRFVNSYFRFITSVKKSILFFTMLYSRRVAIRLRKQLVSAKGESVLNNEVKQAIKAYSRKRFGSKAYWPYLAYYTEVRGQFVEGWMPYDYHRYIKLPVINPQYSCELSNQKTFDYQLFGDFAIKPLFNYISGILLNADFEVVGLEQAHEFLDNYNDIIVVKEENGTQGKQVKMVHSSDFRLGTLNKKINYVIQPYIKQYEAISNVYPESVNTFRVVSSLNSDGSVEIISAILRFGVDGSKIDNLSSNGQFIYFDSAGKPSKLAYDGLGLSTGEKHKNTGYKYSELSIPMYDDILENCKAAHKKYPYIQLIGWDVCVNDKGEPKLVEWNAENPGILPEEAVFGPFWSDNVD